VPAQKMRLSSEARRPRGSRETSGRAAGYGETPNDVHPEHPTESVDLNFVDMPLGGHDASVVDESSNRTELAINPLEQGHDVRNEAIRQHGS
jgi:hypothetical protein